MFKILRFFSGRVNNKRNFAPSILKCSKYSQESITQSDFVPVYNLPIIKSLSVINRLKFYQTILSAVSIPCTTLFYMLGILPGNMIMDTTAVGISGCISLYGLGHLTNKLVGIVYFNEKNRTVKVSFLDFWGKRQNIEMPVEDVVPLTELPVALTDKLYSKFSRYSTKDTLKINLIYGRVLNKEKFNQVFVQEI